MSSTPTDGPVPLPAGQRGLTMEMEAFSKQVEGRNSRIMMAVGFLVLLAIFGGGEYWYTNRPKPPPPELVNKVAELLGTLEKDDTASLEAARQGLGALQTGAPPGFYAPVSGDLIAVSLLASDLRDQIAVLREKAEADDHESKRIERDDKEKADWRARVAAQVDDIKRIKGIMDPLVDQVTKLDEEQNQLFAQVKEARGHSPDDLDLTRSLGIYYGVKGDPTGNKFADHYRKFNATDGWADLITAAYGAQPKQTPDQLKASLQAAKQAFAADGRMLRAKRLEAKLEMYSGDLTAASASATILAAANPSDVNTKGLQGEIATAEAAKAAAPH